MIAPPTPRLAAWRITSTRAGSARRSAASSAWRDVSSRDASSITRMSSTSSGTVATVAAILPRSLKAGITTAMRSSRYTRVVVNRLGRGVHRRSCHSRVLSAPHRRDGVIPARERRTIMAGGVNKVILVGHLGADPDMRYTPSGQGVCELRLATSESWNDKNGQRQERTEWHRIVVWGKRAEVCSKYLSKGRQVFVEGRIQTRTYDDKDGNKRYITEIIANDVQFLGGGRDGGGGGRGGGGGGGGGPDDDIPF